MHSYETLSVVIFYTVIDPATSKFSLSSKLNIVDTWEYANEKYKYISVTLCQMTFIL